MKVCAVIPAAGRGSRLNIHIPKILAPLTPTKTLWSVLRTNLLPYVDHINLIISPQAEPIMRTALAEDLAKGLVSFSIQSQPCGMGDAIFCGHSIWSKAETILVVWGDQTFVSQKTFKEALQRHKGSSKTIALPLAEVNAPYVEYLFANNKLIAIKQSRENECCSDFGYTDVGTFVLSTRGLRTAWHSYQVNAVPGAVTNEINFLPFLPYLSGEGWVIHRVMVEDSIECQGINTPADLLFSQRVYGELS